MATVKLALSYRSAMTLRAYARRLWVHEVAVEVSSGCPFEQDPIRTRSRAAYRPARPGGALRQPNT